MLRPTMSWRGRSVCVAMWRRSEGSWRLTSRCVCVVVVVCVCVWLYLMLLLQATQDTVDNLDRNRIELEKNISG